MPSNRGKRFVDLGSPARLRQAVPTDVPQVDAARDSNDVGIDGIGFDPGSSNSAVAVHLAGVPDIWV